MSIILLASLAPVIVLLCYIYIHDKYQKEPLPMLLKALAGGILAALLDVLLLTIFQFAQVKSFPNELFQASYQAFCQAAIPEEICKFFFLYLFIWKSRYFDEYYDGIEYAACVGLGFAGLENILYVFQGGMGVALSRALFAVPAHFFFAIFMGYFFAFAKFRPWKKRYYLSWSLIVPIILHGIYDFVLMYSDIINTTNTSLALLLNGGFLIFFIFVWRIATRRVKTMSGR